MMAENSRFFATLPGFARALISFVAGVIMVPAMPPWGIWPLLFVGMPLFYVQLASACTVKDALLYGWLFGFGYFAAGLSWIANALLVEGNEFAWVWPLAVAGLPALLAIFTACASALVVKSGDLKQTAGFVLFITIFMIFEWLRGHLFTGFPWNLFGYTWIATPIAQFAAIAGIYGLTMLTLFWSALPGFLAIGSLAGRAKVALIAGAAILMVATYVYGSNRLEQYPTSMRKDIAIRLVQPNIPQSDKWKPDKARANFEKLLALSQPEPINQNLKTLIIWPETAISQAFLARNPEAVSALRAVLESYRHTVYLATGMTRYEQETDIRYFNSLAVFDRAFNPISVYNKSHLVPFGEYIPLQKWVPLAPFVQYAGFTPGSGPQTIALPGIGSFSPLVCYEIIFPGAVSNNDNRPDFIINVTNDAWYGDSAGPHQHFAHARFRAIEEGLPVIRSANTGISGVIDPLGRNVYRAELFSTAGNNVVLPRRLEKKTIYSVIKDGIFWAALLTLPVIFSLRGILVFIKKKTKLKIIEK